MVYCITCKNNKIKHNKFKIILKKHNLRKKMSKKKKKLDSPCKPGP